MVETQKEAAKSAEVTREQEQQVIQTLLDGIDAVAYIVEEGHRLTYVNRRMKRILGRVEMGGKCYREIWNMESPCPFCPMGDQNAHMEKYHDGLEMKFSLDMVRVHNRGRTFHVFTGSAMSQDMSRARDEILIDGIYHIGNEKSFCMEKESMGRSDESFRVLLVRLKNCESWIRSFGRNNFQGMMKELIGLHQDEFGEGRLYSVGQGLMLARICRNEEELDKMIRWLALVNERNLLSSMGSQAIWDSIIISKNLESSTCEYRIEMAEHCFHQMDRETDLKSLILDQSIMDRLEREQTVRKEVIRALDERLFDISIQGIYGISGGEARRCEVLARLRSETFGWIPPGEFVPVVERLGRLEEMTVQIIEKAIRLINTGRLEKERVHVNVPPEVITSRGFFARSSQWRREHPKAASRLCMEITENQSVDHRYLQQAMNAIGRLGYSMAVDDFGAGYSNISYLVDLPIQTLKLDRQLIDRIEIHVSSQILISSIIEMAHELGMEVVAEGVETDRQLHLLRGMGCDMIQGYVFSRPETVTAG